MIHLEVLERSQELPLEIPPAMGGHQGLPSSVLAAAEHLGEHDLVCWNDEISQTCGVAKFNKVILFPRKSLLGLSIDLMRPAKGHGWVALEAKLVGNTAPVPLLQSLVYRSEAINWLLSKKAQIEAVFNFQIEVRDHGSDY